MTIEFSVDHKDDVADDTGIPPLIGWVTATVETRPGNFRVRDVGGAVPRALKLQPRKGYLAANGHMYKDERLTAPFRLVANDPVFNLRELTYRFDFDLTTLVGVPVEIPFCRGPAPSYDTTLYLARLMNDLDQPVIEVRTKGYAGDILDAKEVGIGVVTAGSAAEAREVQFAASDDDFRLNDTRIPTDKSVTLAKLADAIAAVLGFASVIDPSVLRLGHATGSDVTQVELWAGTRALFVNSTGVFFDGNVRIGDDTTATTRTLKIDSPAGQNRTIEWDTAGIARFIIGVTAEAESTGDAGSNWFLRTRHDDGSVKTDVITINRATDVITLLGRLITVASTAGLAGLRVPHGTAPTSPVDGDVWTTTAGLFVRINGVTKQYGTDASNNMLADVFVPGETVTATAAGTTTLTSDSTTVQRFTGTTTQNLLMPTTGITAGWGVFVVNDSTGTVTVKSSDGTTLVAVAAGKSGWFWARQDTPTGSGHWGWTVPDSSGARGNTTVVRDTNTNAFAGGFYAPPNTVTTSGGTLTMTLATGQVQVFTGSTTHTVKLPTTSVAVGNEITIVNQSSGAITVQSSSGAAIGSAIPGGTNIAVKYMALVNSPTAATDWQKTL